MCKQVKHNILTHAWKNKIKKCGKNSSIFVLSFQQIGVPLPQIKRLQPMKTNKKIRNELFFAFIVLSLAVLFAFARLHINKEKQTAGANTAEIFHQP